jgi:CYTH domain-containing protein
MKIEQGVPKRRHIKFRRQEITQKKAYNITKNTLTFIMGVGPYEGFYLHIKIQNNKMLREDFEITFPVFEFPETI